MTEYNTWVTAFKLVSRTRIEVFGDENASPAWEKLSRISDYCNKQAKAAFDRETGENDN